MITSEISFRFKAEPMASPTLSKVFCSCSRVLRSSNICSSIVEAIKLKDFPSSPISSLVLISTRLSNLPLDKSIEVSVRLDIGFITTTEITKAKTRTKNIIFIKVHSISELNCLLKKSLPCSYESCTCNKPRCSC